MAHRSIAKIKVRRLFDRYDYDLYPSDNATDAERLLILYGDNGSGKTTILRTLFHLISPERGQGHKSALAGIPLSEFEVHFSNGDQVWMRRSERKTIGSYMVGIKVGRRKEQVEQFKPDHEGRIKPTAKTNAFIDKLRNLGLAIYFLSDDRSVRFAGTGEVDTPLFDNDLADDEQLYLSSLRSIRFRNAFAQNMEERAQRLLEQSIRRSEQWLQSQAVRSASQGESSVNALYAEILKRISTIPQPSDVTETSKVQDVRRRIRNLEDRSRKFAEYGLAPKFQGKDILDVIKSAPQSHLEIVTTVVTPYLDGVEKKLDATQGLQKRVDTLVKLINSFYKGKVLRYDVHSGFTIKTDDGKPLGPDLLSSGERHLLLLFCNTVQALNKPSIFVIDEPEISLNIKWQRQLLAALLKCAEGQPVQYVLATHSLELLARYHENAIRLETIGEIRSGITADA